MRKNVKNFLVYTDKSTDFEFKVEIEGASLNDAKTRLILFGEKTNFILEGKIKKDGTAKIEIPKLKGLLPENFGGIMKLEVIIEDSYFQPWEGSYLVETEKKVTVNEIINNKENNKPSISVNIKENKTPYQKKIESIVENLSNKDINSKNILNKKNKKYLYSLIEVTFNKSLSLLNNDEIIKDIINSIAKGVK